jgi:NTE family protein
VLPAGPREIALVSGEARSATVVASIPTTVLELERDAFDRAVQRHPVLLANLNRILGRRLVQADRREARRRRRGEVVALVAGRALDPAGPAIGAAAAAASARPVAVLDAERSLPAALERLDALADDHGLVVVVAGLEEEGIHLLLDHVERAVVLVADGAEAERASRLTRAVRTGGCRTEILALDRARPGRDRWRAVGGEVPARMPRAPDRNGAPALADAEVAWLGRHVARTKLGLALGAGGAKGYAHVGALAALGEAGYTVDYVGGSSMGAVVGAYVALGMGVEEVEATLRGAFTPDAVERLFRLSLSGKSVEQELLAQLLRETTGERWFHDLVIPLVVMTVDLGRREPAPITDGPLWRALLAATALAGMFAPVVDDGRRLVDGLALVPVPAAAVAEAGADVTVAVNLMSRDTLPAWPGESDEAVAAAVRRRTGSGMLDTLLEVMELAELDNSVSHAARADVVVTPRFGPASWRDFHLADRFLAAGRAAAEEQLPSLRALASPQPASPPTT